MTLCRIALLTPMAHHVRRLGRWQIWRSDRRDLQFTIYDLGFTIYDLGFTIYDLRFGIWDLGFAFCTFDWVVCVGDDGLPTVDG